jgi:hypothetical protein
MDMWIYIGLFVGALLAVGAWVDWRRRGSARGSEPNAPWAVVGRNPETHQISNIERGHGGGP